MNVLPVINRELRAEARHAFTYWLRVIGAGALLLAAIFFVLRHGLNSQLGGELFAWLHGALQLAIWTLVPLLTADCLSRERREGTLGLLFLTPLKTIDIVIAKSLAHGLRAVTLLLAVLPVVAMPLLMGGVTWKHAVSSLCLNGAALCLALTAGLLASAFSKSWVRALILAFCFAGIFADVFCLELGWLFQIRHPMFSAAYGEDGWFKPGVQLALTLDPEFFANFYYYGYGLRTSGLSAGMMLQGILVISATALAMSFIALLLVTVIAAFVTRRNWQERPPSPLAIWLKNKFCSPVVMLGLLQRWMKRKLDRNPIGWLEQRTWSGRLVTWSWLAVMISVYSLVLTDPNFLTRSINTVHNVMGWILLLSMAVNASTSFRRERETRVLELLLVSPLNEEQIILGRLRGLWGQFLPSIALLLGGWVYLAVALNHFQREFPSIFAIGAAFVSLPVIGLYFSLVCRNFLGALVWTVTTGLVVPAVLSTITHLFFMFLRGVVITDFGVLDLIFHPFVYHVIVAIILWMKLHSRLEERRFATEST